MSEKVIPIKLKCIKDMEDHFGQEDWLEWFSEGQIVEGTLDLESGKMDLYSVNLDCTYNTKFNPTSEYFTLWPNIPGLLHLYGQPTPHDPGYIVADPKGLLALREALDQALVHGRWQGKSGVMTADGEHFDLHVVCLPQHWQATEWRNLAVPYTDETAKESLPDPVFPWQLIDQKDS